MFGISINPLKCHCTVFNLIISGVTYVLVYRTEKYKKLKTSIEKQTKKRE